MDFARAYAEQQREQACHHETLYVVRIAVLERLADDILQAVHVRFAVPEESGQGCIGLERIPLEIARHLRPVETAHEFAPAEDLAHEPLDGSDRGIACPVCLESPVDDLARGEQLEIQ